jgi:hypothetical protein
MISWASISLSSAKGPAQFLREPPQQALQPSYRGMKWPIWSEQAPETKRFLLVATANLRRLEEIVANRWLCSEWIQVLVRITV